MQRFIPPHLVTTCHVKIPFLVVLDQSNYQAGVSSSSCILRQSSLLPYNRKSEYYKRSAGAQCTGTRVCIHAQYDVVLTFDSVRQLHIKDNNDKQNDVDENII